MEISFENKEDDIIALLHHQLDTNSDFKKRKFLNMVVTPLLILSALTVYAIAKKELVSIVAGILGASITFLWYWRAYRVYYRKLLNNIKQKPQKEVLCRHTATITPEGFTEKTAESQNFQSWKAVVDVAFTPEHIFVYNTPITAHVIPRRELGDTLFQQAGDEIRKYKNA